MQEYAENWFLLGPRLDHLAACHFENHPDHCHAHHPDQVQHIVIESALPLLAKQANNQAICFWSYLTQVIQD